ncbi:hypothetical protein MMC16_003789 [Acarospora aff. strigata]|nr:hypothetical protein [Acarospora aff. strigata]
MPRARGQRRTSSQSSNSGQKSSSTRGRLVSTADSKVSDRPRRRSARISSASATREEIRSFAAAAEVLQDASNIGQKDYPRRGATESEKSQQPLKRQASADSVAEGTSDSERGQERQQRLLNPMRSSFQERQTSPQINGEYEQNTGPYEMDIIVQPPAETQPGVALEPPIKARLRAREAVQNVPDMSSIWASVFLTREDGLEVLAPPRTDLLTGPLVNSVSQEAGSDGEVGYVSFPGLTIWQSGSYRLRICLIRMQLSQGASDAPFESGVNFQTIHSRVVHVHAHAEAPLVEICGS